MFFMEVISCAGGLLTREATVTGSVSRMIPSSTSSSTARDCYCQPWFHQCRPNTYHQVVVLDHGTLVNRIPGWVSLDLERVDVVLT